MKGFVLADAIALHISISFEILVFIGACVYARFEATNSFQVECECSSVVWSMQIVVCSRIWIQMLTVTEHYKKNKAPIQFVFRRVRTDLLFINKIFNHKYSYFTLVLKLSILICPLSRLQRLSLTVHFENWFWLLTICDLNWLLLIPYFFIISFPSLVVYLHSSKKSMIKN